MLRPDSRLPTAAGSVRVPRWDPKPGRVRPCADCSPPSRRPCWPGGGSGPSPPAGPPTLRPAGPADIEAALRKTPGLTIVKEDPAPAGFRFFELTFTQPADHRHPGAGPLQQRFTLLHRDFAAPTVAFTSGYNVSTAPNRSEPTQIVDGNQLSMEYRYFTPSRPEPENWAKQLTIWQAAADEHRAVQAFKAIYPGKWLATGGSKGGMTATY